MTTFTSTASYREAIQRALQESDPALIQDALYDVDEFLRSESWNAGTELSDEALAARAVEGFGSPEEVAASYMETELKVAKALAAPTPARSNSGISGLFGVLVDPHAYGSLFLMIFGLLSGLLYFTWATAGVAMSLGFALLIVGVPFFVGFGASLRMLGLMEGRLLESLVGVRMPRRPAPQPQDLGWFARGRYWLTDRRTWTTLLYLILALPVGLIGFVIATILMSLSLAFVLSPFAQMILDVPVITIGSAQWFAPWWAFPIFWLVAILIHLGLLHVAKLFGKARAALARALLVVEPV